MFLEFSQKNTWIQDPFERGPPLKDLKATPCCAAILQPCSYAEAFLPPPLQKVVLLNMVSLFGSKANHACWDDFKNGSPLQQFLLKCENLVWFYLWSERQPETPSYLHQLQQHMPHQSVFFVLDLKANQTAARVNHRKAFKRSMCKNPWQHEAFQTTNNFCSFVSTWQSCNFDFDPIRLKKKHSEWMRITSSQ